MKTPLHYQTSEYDCGPTTLMNAMMFLFEREQIKPEIVRNIMLYCLDAFGSDGRSGTMGTSNMAMMFLSNWLTGYGQAGHLPISSTYLYGPEVNFSQDSLVRDALARGGCAVLRLDLEGWHYVLLTGIEDNKVRVFDCYYLPELPDVVDPRAQMVSDHPTEYNRIIDADLLDEKIIKPYSMGPVEKRECVLLFNEKTELTAEKTIEYFI